MAFRSPRARRKWTEWALYRVEPRHRSCASAVGKISSRLFQIRSPIALTQHWRGAGRVLEHVMADQIRKRWADLALLDQVVDVCPAAFTQGFAGLNFCLLYHSAGPEK